VLAAWEASDSALAANRSVIVKRATLADSAEPELADESSPPERFAQVPNDPFEVEDPEVSEEELPPPQYDDEQGTAEDETDDAAAYDIFEDPAINEPARETLQGESPLESSPEVDVTPTVKDDNTSLEPADTRLFDEMTTEEEGPQPETTDESMQYGRDTFDLNLPPPTTGEMTEEQRKMLEKERVENEESCQEELEKLRSQSLESIDLSIRVAGNPGEDYPFECSLEGEQLEPREWPQITYMWKAAGLCHKPLYFEQVALERYGHSWGPYTQPIMSGVHFFGTLPILPYLMGLQTPNECVYTLGYYRPGNCAPYLVGGVPFTWRAAAYETGAATGISFTIP